MSEERRDWDKELADIDRVIAQQSGSRGAAPAGGSVPERRPEALPEGSAVRRRSVGLTWLWALLALALAVALPIWPYEKSCGLRLFFFLGAAGITGLVGVLGAVASWANRRGLAHVVSLLVIAWSAVVVAGEVLPRTGYARQQLGWGCAAQA
ncbi:MAG: hypothetical protein ACREMX_00105, partial [Gemmatimonadales bacterium]